jgi:hypothetical protein
VTSLGDLGSVTRHVADFFFFFISFFFLWGGAGQDRDMKIANRSFENVSQFKCSGTTVTNQNLMLDEIKRFISGNACYNPVLNHLFSRLLSKSVKIGIFKTVILSVVLYGYETLSVTLREEHRPRGS